VSKELFTRLVDRALDSVPDEVAQAIEGVRIEVCDYPTRAMSESAQVGRSGRLLGLYRGRPKTKRSVEDSACLPDVIYLFQGEIEAICDSEEQLVEQVRVTVLHELGHHFGLNERNLGELGYG
jgi:predicted Zn-dependent protease with MMP-like domain